MPLILVTQRHKSTKWARNDNQEFSSKSIYWVRDCSFFTHFRWFFVCFQEFMLCLFYVLSIWFSSWAWFRPTDIPTSVLVETNEILVQKYNNIMHSTLNYWLIFSSQFSYMTAKITFFISDDPWFLLASTGVF